MTLKRPPRIQLFVTSHCPYCVSAKRFLTARGLPFELIDLTDKPDELQELKLKTQWKTVPQIFIGAHFIGGFTDLMKLEDEGLLEKLLEPLPE